MFAAYGSHSRSSETPTITLLELFLKNHETLKTVVMMLKIQLHVKEKDYIFKYIRIDFKLLYYKYFDKMQLCRT